jgi:hypothetical protein
MASKLRNEASGNLNAYFNSRKCPGPIQGLKVGEEVSYTRYFLLQTCTPATDDMWRARGEVVELHANGVWARVHWKGEEGPRLIALQHLARPGANTRFAD